MTWITSQRLMYSKQSAVHKGLEGSVRCEPINQGSNLEVCEFVGMLSSTH